MDTARSAETGAEYRDRYKIAAGPEITAGADENRAQNLEQGATGGRERAAV